jgi:hypothetical protein
MQKHITILSVLFLVLGIIGMTAAAIVLVALAGGGWLSGDRDAILITSGLGVVVASFIAALSLPTLLAGIGLARRRPWARVLALVVAGLQLFNLPFGTALGVYAFWVLLQEESGQLMLSS